MTKENTPHILCSNCTTHCMSAFSDVSENIINNLEDNKTCSLYKKGQVLFHEGTRPLGVFCINSGKVKIYKHGSEGKDQIVQIAKEGDLLGYRALLGEELYPVSAETLEDTKICFIGKSDFLQLLTNSPGMVTRLLKSACHELGIMTENVTNLAQKSVRERFAISLIMLHETYYNKLKRSNSVVINLTREDLANIVGTATETLIRLLHDFKQEKVLETEGRKIKILDLNKLAKIGGLT